jgi:hypothetical protein
MDTNLEKRVKTAFKEDNERNIIGSYLERIYSNSQAADAALRQSIIRLFFLFFLFFLLINTSIGEIDFGILKIKDINLITKIIPLIISINYYELVSLMVIVILQQRLIDAIFSTIYKPIKDEHLSLLLYPCSTTISSEAISRFMPDNRKFGKFSADLATIFTIVIVAGAIICLCWIFVVCFETFGMLDWMLWIIFIISLLFLVKSIFTLYSGWSATG